MQQTQHILFFMFFFLFVNPIQGQSFRLSIGTDFPFQHYIGGTLETNKIDISLRTGILAPPYSDIILNISETFGAEDIFINLLDATYDLGWMNSLGAYYKFGQEKKWYLGADFRLDYLTGADSRSDLLEAILGESSRIRNRINNNNDSQIDINLTMFALGLRAGRSFAIDKNNHHIISVELSINKYIATQTTLKIDNQEDEDLSQILDDLFWEEVFKPYGFVGGIGVSYSYRF